MRLFSIEEVIIIHKKLVDRFGGVAGYDPNTLEICLFQPFQTFDGKELYRDDLHKICMIAYLIIKKHPFVDGNKRVGVLLLILGLRQNGYRFNLSSDKVIELGLNIAANKWGINELISLIEKEQKV